MLYFKSSQPIPGKGQALTFYECDDTQRILRIVTYIPATSETERIDKPVVKKLYRPELLSESSAEEFNTYYGK